MTRAVTEIRHGSVASQSSDTETFGKAVSNWGEYARTEFTTGVNEA
jgi:hypothetical protein